MQISQKFLLYLDHLNLVQIDAVDEKNHKHLYIHLLHSLQILLLKSQNNNHLLSQKNRIGEPMW